MILSNGPLTAAVRDIASAEGSSITLGLRSGAESDPLAWMRGHAESLVLEVNYSPVTAVPSGLAVAGVGCLAPAGGRVAGSAPVLSGVPRHSEGSVRAEFQVLPASLSEVLASWLSEPGATGEEVTWQVDPPLADGSYRWRMRSVRADQSAASGWSGLCAFTVDSSRDAEPPAEEPEPVDCPVTVPPPGEDELQAADESVALLLAQACDVPVEVTSQRDFASRVLAQPAGTLLAEEYNLPQWAHDAEGDWAEVDTGLATRPDGTIATAAAVSTVEVSPGGDADPLVTATDPDGGSVSLTWPEPLPAPVVDGDTATYPEVYPDVDLQVEAGVDGFS